jgi:uncharacterized protein (TIGR00106 family)
MNILCDFNLVAIGSGVSLSKYIADCENILRKYGLKTNIHALGTNIEGDWDTISIALKECHTYLHEKCGIQRILSTVKISSRIDKPQSIEEKIDAVKKHI